MDDKDLGLLLRLAGGAIGSDDPARQTIAFLNMCDGARVPVAKDVLRQWFAATVGTARQFADEHIKPIAR